jgi:hypothetical protein
MSASPNVTVKFVKIGPNDVPNLPGFEKAGKSRATHKVPTNLVKHEKTKREKKEKKESEADKITTFKKMGEALITKQNNHTYLETHDLSKDITELKFNVCKLTEDIKALQTNKTN